MRIALRAGVWIALYLAVAVAPLVFALLGTTRPGQGFVTDLSVALGYVGLAMMGLQLVLVARFTAVAGPFGQDGLLQFHRQIGLIGLGMVLAHVALSAEWSMLASLDPAQTPWRVRFGVIAIVALVVLTVTSVWRSRLRISYEAWHLLHAGLSIAAIGAAVSHILLVDYYIDSLWKRGLWLLMAVGFIGLIAWVRIIKPLRLGRRPWKIERVESERGNATTLSLTPVGHEGFRFEPGQFGWFTIGRSPLTMTRHPFSFSSSAETVGAVSVSIKALGDFTATVSDLKPGTTVYVDGPHGVFTIDQHEGAGFCFLVAGVGITPIMSMLRTLADRGDARPVILIYANRHWDDVTFRDQISELEPRLDLRVTHVLSGTPPVGWRGEVGRISAELLADRLPAGYRRFQFFVCGPDPMMDAMEHGLLDLGVAPERIHTERFGWV